MGFTLEKDGNLVCGATLEEAIKAVDKATRDQVRILFSMERDFNFKPFVPQRAIHSSTP